MSRPDQASRRRRTDPLPTAWAVPIRPTSVSFDPTLRTASEILTSADAETRVSLPADLDRHVFLTGSAARALSWLADPVSRRGSHGRSRASVIPMDTSASAREELVKR
jgi:hypothetical protein